jgi:nucleoside-diphosphate-sugar epimerase
MNNQRKIKKALVTGAAGFIGSHLVEELIKRNIEVVSFDDLSAGKISNLDHIRGSNLLTVVKGDVTDLFAIKNAMNGVDTVFHQAASKKNICLSNPSRDLEVNGGGALKLLQTAIELGVEKFVHASTGSVYGEPIIFPSNESHRVRPNSYYGVSKLAGESYVNCFAQLYGLNTTVLRYFHVYGPRQESNELGGVVSIFLRRALRNLPIIIHGDGNQVRTFTWVKDIVEANILAATLDVSKHNTYNCASGISVSINDLAKLVISLTNSKSKVVFEDALLGDIRDFDIDNSKIKNDFNIKFNTDFKTCLKLTLDWAIKELTVETIAY